MIPAFPKECLSCQSVGALANQVAKNDAEYLPGRHEGESLRAGGNENDCQFQKEIIACTDRNDTRWLIGWSAQVSC